MEEFKVVCFWLDVILVLLYGCWFVDAKTVGHTMRNHSSSSDTVFRHEIQYQEGPTSVVYTLAGNDNHAPCVFPFIYNRKKYTQCLNVYQGQRQKKPWCATTSNFDRDEKWGRCQTDNDVTDCMDRHSRCGDWARNGECVVNYPFMRDKCPRSCGLCTYGGNGRGRACTFPFFYKNRFVYDCLYFNKKPWCATTTNYNKDKRWGYCFPKLYRNIKAVNRKYLYWGECDDQHTECRSWAKKGMCEEQPSKMDSWCPWSCHKCAPELMVTHKGCRDHSSSCKDWAKNGDCMNKPVFMTAFCRWTCKHCAKKSVATTVQDRMPKDCKKWMQNGDCYLHQEFMLQNCRASCMAGGYVNGKMCLDRVANCHTLARQGYCREPTSRNIMIKYCRYSCRWCK
ncbi:uncharacterized protein LOC144636382 [Oculina patagonica]